jgi:uncharacterized protein
MKNYHIDQQDIELLRSQRMTEDDLSHSIQVAEKALDIARPIKQETNMEFVGRGVLFHDLGKTVTHEITHGLEGAMKAVCITGYTVRVLYEK